MFQITKLLSRDFIINLSLMLVSISEGLFQLHRLYGVEWDYNVIIIGKLTITARSSAYKHINMLTLF